ncbi:MAG: pilus assembly protein, partial [Anaerolineae bacterium]
IFGIIEFSRLFFAYATMSHGVREAARYGVVHHGEIPDIKKVAQDKIFLIGGTASISVTYPISISGSSTCPHLCPVQVRAASTYNAWTPLVPDFEIVAQATMHHE